jgi:hypothetical protein
MIRPRKVGKRGFHVDKEATAMRAFANRRSFVSKDGHDVLFGIEDTRQRRAQIYNRAQNRCELRLSPYCVGIVRWFSRGLEGWAHLDVEPHRNHCDCLENGACSCDPCHRWFHAHSKRAREILRRRAAAHQEFDKINPPEAT